MKVGDTVQFKDPHGSLGIIDSISGGYAYVSWHYGMDAAGQPITSQSGLRIDQLEPISELFYKEYCKLRAWSDDQHKLRAEYFKRANGHQPKEQLRPYSAKRSVLQDWTNALSFMMQSVLICACRGPDGIRKDHPVKVLCRYLRRSFLICAFDGKVRWSPYEPGGGSFTGPLNLHGTGEGEGHLDKYIEIYLRHVDEIAHHYQLHFMHAAEILGYKHPDNDVRGFWRAMYLAIVNDAHLRPEPEEVMDKRLGDVEKQWREAEVVTAQ